MKWREWFDLTEDYTGWPLREEWGIYRIRLVDTKGVPVQIGRIGGTDRLGIVYLGRSGKSTAKTVRTLGQRIWEFQWAKQHSGGETWQLSKVVLERIGTCAALRLQASVVALPNGKIDDAEKAAMRMYFNEFGELPPCNSAYPGKYL